MVDFKITFGEPFHYLGTGAFIIRNNAQMTARREEGSTVLYIEPFYGGSHKQLMDLLMHELPGDLYTLPGTKWHWRMRTSALHFSLILPHKHSYR